MQELRPSKQTKPPTYLFSIPNCQRARQNQNRCAVTSWRNRSDLPRFPYRRRPFPSVFGPSRRRFVVAAASVRGFLRRVTGQRKRFFRAASQILRRALFCWGCAASAGSLRDPGRGEPGMNRPALPLGHPRPPTRDALNDALNCESRARTRTRGRRGPESIGPPRRTARRSV